MGDRQTDRHIFYKVSGRINKETGKDRHPTSEEQVMLRRIAIALAILAPYWGLYLDLTLSTTDVM